MRTWGGKGRIEERTEGLRKEGGAPFRKERQGEECLGREWEERANVAVG